MPSDDLKRRSFLQGMGGAVPTLQVLASAAPPAAAAEKFTPLDLSGFYNASPAEFGPRPQLRFQHPDGLVDTPAGRCQFRGIPFLLGREGVASKRWLMLSTEARPWTRPAAEIPIGAAARYVCLAQFCDWEDVPSTPEQLPKTGQALAHAALVYQDGAEAAFPIRRRLEVCAPNTVWGQRALLALAHPQLVTMDLNEPLSAAFQWGSLQTTVREDAPPPLLWIWALANPHPGRTIRSLRLTAAGGDLLAVCGITLFHGEQNPLRYDRLTVYRITLPDGAAERWHVDVDLGVVARTYVLPEFNAESWLASPAAGVGAAPQRVEGARHLYAEVAASPEATLTVRDTDTGRTYLFDLRAAAPGKQIAARSGGGRVEFLERDKAWLHCRIIDPATQKPVPVRLAFRSKEGRYIPPYGHRTEINPGWFQDYGADVKLGADSFAYVDGEFQAELPTGEVYVEAAKGFEYAPIRQRLHIEPGQRELRLEIAKYADLRAQGWVNADTHVHFLSPSTAILEGQGEGLNLINLLSAQWGDLYTSFGDLAHGPIASRDGEVVVWPGTENRHHLMGHIGLLGAKGRPVLPLSGGFPYGPDEAYPGDPLFMSMAEWADTCRAREGLAVAVHFPNPLAELVADVALGKIDAVEIPPQSHRFQDENYVEWYRYLNCGYRLPIAGGTDKMSSTVAVGRARTYAYIGREEFSFANWAKAVRHGNTFATSGPLLLFRADGRVPGEEIAMRAGGGAVEVEAHARCFTPVRSVEIVVNGKVVASREASGNDRELVLREKVRVPAPGWVAARCGALDNRAGRVAAHTSPVYLTVPGQELFSAPIAAYMMKLIDGTQAWVETIATRAEPERYERIRKVLLDARADLQRRLRAHA